VTERDRVREAWPQTAEELAHAALKEADRLDVSGSAKEASFLLTRMANFLLDRAQPEPGKVGPEVSRAITQLKLARDCIAPVGVVHHINNAIDILRIALGRDET